MIAKDFKCKQCGKIQEIWLKKSDHLPSDPCVKCGAPQYELEQMFSVFPRHVSWSTWNNLSG